MKRFEIVLEATTFLLMVLVLAVLTTLVERLRKESPIIYLSCDSYVDEEARRIIKDYKDITQKADVLPYKSAQTNLCYNIEWKPNEGYYTDDKPYEGESIYKDEVDDDVYSLVFDEKKIREAAKFYQNFDKKAIENPYADETHELSPYALFPDGGKLIDAFDAKYSCKCSEIGAPK